MDLPLMSRGIDALLEGLEADAANGVEEALVRMAALDVRLDEALDHVRHVLRGERRADHLAEGCVVALRSADRYLVPLGTALVDAEDADVADVVLAAGVHASRHVEVELADVVQVIEIVEAPRDRFGN